MKSLSDAVICCVDHGLFIPVAAKLAEQCKHVYWWSPWDRAYPTIKEWVVGEGYDNMTRVENIWDVKKDCDGFAFFDIGFGGLQLELESQGFPTWGSRKADSLESNRGKFLKTIERLGMPVPKYKVITGITKLREHLKGKSDKYVKISRWRGDAETTHWRDWDHDEGWLDLLAVKLGPMKDMIAFYVCDPIETDIEDGIDTFCINGIMPKMCIHGFEEKDKSYLATIAQADDIAPVVREASEMFAPVLAEYGYRNFFSTEVRVKGDQGYFIDPCNRCGSPPAQVMTELYSNLGDIIWAGANGECIEPEPAAEFGAQALIKTKGDRHSWAVADIPKEIRQWVKAGNSCQIDGILVSPPDADGSNDLGWLCAIGDTIQDTLDSLNDYARQLPDGLECDPSSLAHLLKEIHQAEDEHGIEFTDQEVPEPSAVLESNGD
jgi:hypothetical protein